MADSRAVAPVAGKLLEAGVVVLYIGLLSTAFYGGFVPDYRTAAGAEIADRTLAETADRIEASVPPRAFDAERRRHVALPDTIRGSAYALRVEAGPTLVLDHPLAGVGGRTRLVLPSSVAAVEGSWASDRPAVVVVRDGDAGFVLRLEVGAR